MCIFLQIKLIFMGKVCTRTCFDKQVQGNSEMAYYLNMLMDRMGPDIFAAFFFLLFINLHNFDLIKYLIFATYCLFFPLRLRLVLVDKPFRNARLKFPSFRHFESNLSLSVRSCAVSNFVNYCMYVH